MTYPKKLPKTHPDMPSGWRMMLVGEVTTKEDMCSSGVDYGWRNCNGLANHKVGEDTLDDNKWIFITTRNAEPSPKKIWLNPWD